MPPISAGQILTGSLFNEPMRVETVQADGPESWVVGLVGMQSERFRKVTLIADELKHLTIVDGRHSFDADAYADVKSIREAMDRRRAPFYLRRTKEAMVYFPERRPDGT